MDENKINSPEEAEEAMIYTLQDEDGKEYQFTLLATTVHKGVNYYAMIPADEAGDDEFLEYTVLKGVMENGEESLVSIDDDDEFEDVAAIFDNMFSEEIDYDAE
jgi:uncharacterized protein YrzB (UPF0473 family)